MDHSFREGLGGWGLDTFATIAGTLVERVDVGMKVLGDALKRRRGVGRIHGGRKGTEGRVDVDGKVEAGAEVTMRYPRSTSKKDTLGRRRPTGKTSVRKPR